MLIQLYRDNYTTTPKEQLNFTTYDGYYDGNINSPVFSIENIIGTGATNDLTSLSTMTGNTLIENDTQDKSVIVEGYFRAKYTGEYTFGLIAESLDNPTYEGIGPYPQSAPIDENSAISLNTTSLLVFNFRLDTNSTGVIAEIGGSGAGSCITVFNNGDIKTLQIYHFRSPAIPTPMNIEQLIDISEFVGQNIQLVLFLVKDGTTGFWENKVIISSKLMLTYNVNLNADLAGTNYSSIGGIDRTINGPTNPDTLPENFFRATNNYVGSFYSHKLWYSSLPTNTNVKADLYFNNSLLIDKNNGTYDFQPLTATINLTAGSYYLMDLYLGKNSNAYFSAYYIEPNSSTKISNATGLTTYYDINPDTQPTQTTGIFPLVLEDDSLQGLFKVSVLAHYSNRTNFTTNRHSVLYIASDDLFNNFNGTYKNYIQIHDKPARTIQRKRFTQFSSDMSFECELNGKIEVRFRRGTTEPTDWRYAMLILDVERIPVKNI